MSPLNPPVAQGSKSADTSAAGEITADFKASMAIFLSQTDSEILVQIHITCIKHSHTAQAHTEHTQTKDRQTHTHKTHTTHTHRQRKRERERNPPQLR